MNSLQIQLLGGFLVAVDGVLLPDERWRSRRIRNLVKLLALAPGHRLHREQVVESLWPDADLSAGTRNLNQALYQARQVLPDNQNQCLTLQEGFLSLACEEDVCLTVDVEQFQAAAKHASDSHTIEACQNALHLYTGPLLPDDPYEEWTLAPREELRRTYVELLFELALLQESSQELAQAIQTLHQLLSADPAHETAHTRLMRLFALNGQRYAALQQYQTLRAVMRAQFEAEPGPEAVQLYEDIQSGRLSEAPAPVVSARSNLPLALTSFIGREAEIQTLTDLIETSRLVTLTGSGGVGKTRLALKAAERWQSRFTHGVAWVDLAPLPDPGRIIEAVASALQLKAYGDTPLPEILDNYLRNKDLLLVLDNCEHLLEAVTGLNHHLLQVAPGLKVLATSRAPLGIGGETAYRVPSMTFPQALTSQNAGDLTEFEAVQLFVERAQAVQMDFRLTPDNLTPVAHICRRLDGIPLAIELAAARVRMLSLDQIANRLDLAFHLLTGGDRMALPRHQTLRASIDWSYELLSPQERILLNRLSVFAGGWTLEAAEQVCADLAENGPEKIQIHQVLDLLGGLIDQSLVQFEPVIGAEPRYRLLETVRQYAHEKLVERGEEAAVRERHLDYFVSLGQQAEPHLRAWQAKYWLERLDREFDNLRHALENSNADSINKGLQLASSLWWFWHIRNHSLEGAEWLKQLLQEQQSKSQGQILDTDGRVARGRALNVLCNIYKTYYANGSNHRPLLQKVKEYSQESQLIFQKLGEFYQRDYVISRIFEAETIEDFLEFRSLFQTLDDPFWISECDLELSRAFPVNDNRALFYGEEHLSLRKSIGDLDGIGWATTGLGLLEFYRGNTDRFLELMLEGLSCLETVGNRLYAGVVHSRLAQFYISQGNFQEALRQSELLLSTARETNNQALLIEYHTRRAYIAWENQDYEQASFYCNESLKTAKNFPIEKRLLAFYLLGRIALSQGKVNQAKMYLKNIFRPETFPALSKFSLDPALEIGNSSVQAMGILAALDGHIHRAATWFGVQDGLFGTYGWLSNSSSPSERNEYKRTLESIRNALGEEAFQAAWETGRNMTVEQVIQLGQDMLN